MATFAVALAQRDVTENPGILPIQLGNGRLQSSSHTFIHFLDVAPLIQGYQSIIKQFFLLKNKTKADGTLQKHLINNFEIIHHTNRLIREKLSIFIKSTRTKRGLINGLGFVIKELTGNLDADDGEHFENSLKELKQNQYNLLHQINNQYSVNTEIMLKFNDTLKTIRANEKQIIKRLEAVGRILTNTVSSNINILNIKITIDEISNILSIILNVLQDIENSIAFCHLKIVHPSIITNVQLMSELKKIYPHYVNHFPFNISNENIKYYKEILKPECIIKNQQVLYTLTLPLFSKQNFELFYFLPIPNKNFISLIPNHKYILYSESKVIPLSDICNKVKNTYLCLKQNANYGNTTCETSILKKEDIQNCLQIELPVENILEYIPETNQYLAAVAKPTTLKSNCENTWSTQTLKGIYLFDAIPCNHILGNQPLMFGDKTYGKPLILQDFKITNMEKPPHLPKLKLKQISLSKLSSNLQPMKLNFEEEANYHLYGTVLLYAALTIFVVVLVYRKFKKRTPTVQVKLEKVTTDNTELKNIRL